MERNKEIEAYLEQHQRELEHCAQSIFLLAEAAEEEVQSAGVLADFLIGQGFRVEKGVGGMPTSIRAQWGSGHPIIGFLGEYDALPELNQEPVPYRSGDPQKNGHGCGHNLLGTGAAGAAAALASALKTAQQEGTVVFYGCPAEEILKGKVVMLNQGCFRELDVAITWHPGMENRCGELSYLAMDSVQFHFQGKAAHASAAPHMGRSALDACELMNVGSNYLREHTTDDVRIHYANLPNGNKPNIVPAAAGVWYFIRARQRENVNDVTARIIDIARGAALMTSTKVEWNFLSRGYGTLVNFTLCRLMHQIMSDLGHPGFTEEDKQFARELAIHSGDVEENGVLDEQFDQPTGSITYMTGSTDVSDVSQVVPTVNIRVACGPKNIVLHSWQYAACAGAPVGRQGMMFAAHIMAQAGWQLVVDPELLGQVKEEFQQTAKGYVDLTERGGSCGKGYLCN
ncbi:MAG: amidohydrolase [Lawsonibacter sp.]|jgi:aminobenzoyl-glutamate utilization protein B